MPMQCLCRLHEGLCMSLCFWAYKQQQLLLGADSDGN